MAVTYILFSKSIDKYYTGSCIDFKSRLEEHNSGFYNNSFTKRARDWTVYFLMEGLNREEARYLEKFIKRMKTRSFYNKLKENPQIATDIIRKRH